MAIKLILAFDLKTSQENYIDSDIKKVNKNI